MILAGPQDRDDITGFLMKRPEVAMFPICNLRDYGMAGGHPRAMTFWIRRLNGAITDVLGLTDGGFVMPVFTSDDPPDVVPLLRGRAVAGVVGQAAPVAAIQTVMKLRKGSLDRDEPHLELALDALQMPVTKGLEIGPVTPVLRDVAIAWRGAYGVETLELSRESAAEQAVGAVDAMISQDSHRVLFRDGQPVALTGFTARLPEIVMVGGVYTPPELRGRGFARAALALHLSQARVEGVHRAVLSAANQAAANVYLALGFRQIGAFRIVAYDTLQVAHG